MLMRSGSLVAWSCGPVRDGDRSGRSFGRGGSTAGVGAIVDFGAGRVRSRGRFVAIRGVGGESGWEREEKRWQREEERWVREEERWRREEARWAAEKLSMQEEMAAMRDEVVALRAEVDSARAEGGITDLSLRSLVGGMRALLQSLAEADSPTLARTRILSTSEEIDVSRQSLLAISSVAPIPEPQPQPPSSVPMSSSSPSTSFDPSSVSSPPRSSGSASNPSTSTPFVSSSPPRSPGASSPPNSSGSSSRASSGSAAPAARKSRNLKSGMDGDDVRELQEALARLGFYSGEEEMEFDTFSSGTDSAVKTWQATIGVAEDGLVTPELLAILLGERTLEGAMEGEKKSSGKGNGAVTEAPKAPSQVKAPSGVKEPTRSAREIDRFERTNAEDTNGSLRRVYLLGENRWEEPERLIKKKPTGSSIGLKVVTEKCFSCRGVRTMLCTDCEGTGDLNCEEQFLEWVGDDAKCPYCEGLGAVPCDVCAGQVAQV